MGYFQLALAAALEDRANPEALYVVYMKLAEIHGNHLPDAQLCQVYRDRAQSLKRVLAGEDGTATAGEDSMNDADTEPGHREERGSDADVEHTESPVKRNGVVIPMHGKEKCQDTSFPRTYVMHKDTEETCTDIIGGDTNEGEDPNINVGDTDGSFVDASGSETETITSQSCSDSILTGSFDTAKEQISDSSSSTDTLQTPHNQTAEKHSDFDTANSMPSHRAVNHMTGDTTRHTETENTDFEMQDERNTPTKETEADADPVQKDVSQSDAEQAETVSMNTDEA